MARPYSPLHLVIAFLLTTLALQSNASPTTPRDEHSLVMFNSSLKTTISHCYTPAGADTPGIEPTELDSCNQALAVLVRTPDFTTRFRFSRNPRTLARKLPTGWQMGDNAHCRIIVNCLNDRDTAVFRYADIVPIAKRIIDNCVDKLDTHGRYPFLIWGGVDRLLDQDNFYVAVARPLLSAQGDGIANGTIVAGEGLFDGSIEIL